MLLSSIWVYPLLERRLGALMTFNVCLGITIVLMLLLPLAQLPVNASLAATWSLLIVLSVVIRYTINSCFTSISIFVNNSVAREDAGAVNGLAMSVTALTRTVGPFLFGALWQWSITNGLGYPLDARLTFYAVRSRPRRRPPVGCAGADVARGSAFGPETRPLHVLSGCAVRAL